MNGVSEPNFSETKSKVIYERDDKRNPLGFKGS
jgi:hypothetical protein